MQALGAKKDSLSNDVDQLEASADRVSREGKLEQPGASGKMGEAADAIRDQRIRDKIAFSKRAMASASSDYVNAFEDQISSNLGEVADKMREAAGAIGQAQGRSATGKSRALDQTRELVRGLESLRDQMADRAARRGQQGQQAQGQQGQGQQGQGQQGQGQQGQGQQGKGQQGQQGGQGQAQGQQNAQGQQGGQGQNGQGQQSAQAGQGGQGGQRGGQQNGQRNGASGGQNPSGGSPTDGNGATSGDPRQLTRSFGYNRQNAEALRRQLAGQGVDTRDLDKAIAALRDFEAGRSGAIDDPRGAERLQSAVIEGLKDFEFALARKLGGAQAGGPALGTRSPVPEEYRAAVEEYYRSLAAGRREK
jgi:hypothetical protein